MAMRKRPPHPRVELGHGHAEVGPWCVPAAELVGVREGREDGFRRGGDELADAGAGHGSLRTGLGQHTIASASRSARSARQSGRTAIVSFPESPS